MTSFSDYPNYVGMCERWHLKPGHEQNMLIINIKLKLFFLSVFRDRVYHNKVNALKIFVLKRQNSSLIIF